MDCLDASVQKSPLEWLVPGVHDEREWSLTRSESQLEIGPYRMAWSCPPPDIGGYHVGTAVSQLITDLHAHLLIEVSVNLVVLASVDWRLVMSDLLISFTSIGRP